MKLYKDNVVLVSGYDGEEDNRFNCFFISNDEQIDDEPITQNEVQEADIVYLEYHKYEDLGDITDEEIDVLHKFKII